MEAWKKKHCSKIRVVPEPILGVGLCLLVLLLGVLGEDGEVAEQPVLLRLLPVGQDVLVQQTLRS